MTTTILATGAGVGSSVVVAVMLGLGLGVGLLLALTGLWGITRRSPRLGGRRVSWWADQRVLRRLALAVGAGVVAGVVTGWVAGAVLAGLGIWVLPRVLGRDTEHSCRLRRIEAIAAWAEMLRDILAAAAGLEQAILATAPLAPEAIRAEVSALAARLEQGRRLAPALRELGDALADPTADVVIAALVMAAERQPRRLTDLLASLASAAREQAAMRMRVHAARARTRTSVRVIVATTCAFAAGLVLLNRPYLQAYDTPTGQLVLLGVGALFAAGFTGLVRMAAMADPARFLPPATSPDLGSGGPGDPVAQRPGREGQLT